MARELERHTVRCQQPCGKPFFIGQDVEERMLAPNPVMPEALRLAGVKPRWLPERHSDIISRRPDRVVDQLRRTAALRETIRVLFDASYDASTLSKLVVAYHDWAAGLRQDR